MSKVTLTLLKKIFPGTPNSKLTRFVEPFNIILPKYGITNKLRFAAFIANVGIESDRLKALEEYASGAAYEGRCKGLGNCRKGDGVRYKGRSVLQTTGRYNYWRVVVSYLRILTGKDWSKNKAGKEITLDNFNEYLKSPEYTALLKEADKYNINFLAKPELLETFPHAVEAAGVFVKDNNLNKYADKGRDGFYAYAGILNTGSAKKKATHYTDRLALYDLAMSVIPDSFNLVKLDEPVEKPSVETPATPTEELPLPPSVVPVENATIPVPQVTPEKDDADKQAESVTDKEVSGIQASTAGAVTFITTTLGGILTFLSGYGWQIIIGIALFGAVFVMARFWYANREKERIKAETKERLDRENALKMQREQHAYELQKLTLESAMRKDLNSVTIVPPPITIENSDPEVEK